MFIILNFHIVQKMCGMSLTMLDRKPEMNMLVEFRPMDYSSELNDMQYVILQKKKKKTSDFFLWNVI